ncbi:hypothetical protein ACSBR2_035354 [Camellia fascicularis]
MMHSGSSWELPHLMKVVWFHTSGSMIVSDTADQSLISKLPSIPEDSCYTYSGAFCSQIGLIGVHVHFLGHHVRHRSDQGLRLGWHDFRHHVRLCECCLVQLWYRA